MNPSHSPPGAASQQARLTFDWLTAARAFFVTWIILRHMSPEGGMAHWVRVACPSLDVFDIPTNFFFLLSGVMFSTGRLMSSEPGSSAAFWKSRLSRLAPVYLLAVLISAPIGWKAADGNWLVFLSAGLAEALFLQGFAPSWPSWNMTGWFMSAIACCYFLYPFIVRRLQSQATRPLVIVYVVCAAYCVTAAVLAGAIFLNQDLAQLPRRIPVLSIPMFVNGIILGLLIKRGQIGTLLVLTIPVALIAFAAAVMLVKNGIYLFIAAAIWPPVLLALVYLPAPAPAWLKWVGERAFILYALHWPLYVYVKSLAGLHAPLYSWLSTPLGTALFFALLLIVAELVRVWIEQPAMRLFRPARP